MSTTVSTQEELDAALARGDYEIVISSPEGVWLNVTSTGSSRVVAWGSSRVVARDFSRVVAWDSSRVVAWGSSRVVAWGSSRVVARDSSRVVAWGSSRVVAYGSSSVEARDSSSVVARGSSRVEARDSSSVVARDFSRVEAYGSSRVVARGASSVVARGASSVVARDFSRVEAYGSSRVVARGSSRVEASKFTAVHLHSGRATVNGGVLIDLTRLDLDHHQDWADYHGVTTEDGHLIVYKAVDSELKSGRGFAYPIGETVTAPDWEPGDFCGRGLHFCPSPAQAREYHPEATRFLKCAVHPDDTSIIDGAATYSTPKIKARAAKVLAEVDIHGDEVAS